LCPLNFDSGQILLDQTKIERTDFGQKAFSDFMILNVACKFYCESVLEIKQQVMTNCCPWEWNLSFNDCGACVHRFIKLHEVFEIDGSLDISESIAIWIGMMGGWRFTEVQTAIGFQLLIIIGMIRV
jgi:hypothetical protein